MSKSYLIENATIVNEGRIFKGHAAVADGIIKAIIPAGQPLPDIFKSFLRIDATGLHLLPGVIDDQVHFREPGLTYKGDIYTESRAAVAGGITSFMEMPNTIPNTLTDELLEEKFEIASRSSVANFSFYLGASNHNIKDVVLVDPSKVCGIKVFMGSSTGNMLVDDRQTLENIFAEAPCLVAVHCEHEPTIRENLIRFRQNPPAEIHASVHPLLRSAEACYRSSAEAVELATRYNTRLHILHLSSKDEMKLFQNDRELSEKRITAEVCIHHLWFNDSDYARKGNWIKWNPAVKSAADQQALWEALLDNRLDVIATDHAPHSYEEKSRPYFESPSGGPLVQHALPAMLDFYHQKKISLERIVDKMCHNPAIAFQIDKRGYIREGYHADLVLVDLNKPNLVDADSIRYKCGWSPFEGHSFRSSVTHTFVSGHLAYEKGEIHDEQLGARLMFNR
ncbi:MAG: dihydroorotase [Bacteroidetes bacterium]|nr:MAG: dihydroorotase [Bacteroidota bacterium]